MFCRFLCLTFLLDNALWWCYVLKFAYLVLPCVEVWAFSVWLMISSRFCRMALWRRLSPLILVKNPQHLSCVCHNSNGCSWDSQSWILESSWLPPSTPLAREKHLRKSLAFRLVCECTLCGGGGTSEPARRLEPQAGKIDSSHGCQQLQYGLVQNPSSGSTILNSVMVPPESEGWSGIGQPGCWGLEYWQERKELCRLGSGIVPKAVIHRCQRYVWSRINIINIFLYLNFLLLYVCWEWYVHERGGQRSKWLSGVIISFHIYVGSGDWTQVFRLVWQVFLHIVPPHWSLVDIFDQFTWLKYQNGKIMDEQS